MPLFFNGFIAFLISTSSCNLLLTLGRPSVTNTQRLHVFCELIDSNSLFAYSAAFIKSVQPLSPSLKNSLYPLSSSNEKSASAKLFHLLTPLSSEMFVEKALA